MNTSSFPTQFRDTWRSLPCLKQKLFGTRNGSNGFRERSETIPCSLSRVDVVVWALTQQRHQVAILHWTRWVKTGKNTKDRNGNLKESRIHLTPTFLRKCVKGCLFCRDVKVETGIFHKQRSVSALVKRIGVQLGKLKGVPNQSIERKVHLTRKTFLSCISAENKNACPAKYFSRGKLCR